MKKVVIPKTKIVYKCRDLSDKEFKHASVTNQYRNFFEEWEVVEPIKENEVSIEDVDDIDDNKIYAFIFEGEVAVLARMDNYSYAFVSINTNDRPSSLETTKRGAIKEIMRESKGVFTVYEFNTFAEFAEWAGKII